ncbi:hypothetical protein [Streptomyces sp. NPDC057694]
MLEPPAVGRSSRFALSKDGTPVRRFLNGMAVVFVVALGIRISLAL